MEEERIQKFLDLILNEHYCEDCNELCSTGEAFPLEFVAKYIIKLKEDNNELKKYYASRKEVEDLKETIACLHESSKEMFIPISVIQNTLEELQIDRNAIKKEIEEAKKEKNKEYYADLLSHLRVNYGAIQVLKEILEKGNK